MAEEDRERERAREREREGEVGWEDRRRGRGTRWRLSSPAPSRQIARGPGSNSDSGPHAWGQGSTAWSTEDTSSAYHGSSDPTSSAHGYFSAPQSPNWPLPPAWTVPEEVAVGGEGAGVGEGAGANASASASASASAGSRMTTTRESDLLSSEEGKEKAGTKRLGGEAVVRASEEVETQPGWERTPTGFWGQRPLAPPPLIPSDGTSGGTGFHTPLSHVSGPGQVGDGGTAEQERPDADRATTRAGSSSARDRSEGSSPLPSSLPSPSLTSTTAGSSRTKRSINAISSAVRVPFARFFPTATAVPSLPSPPSSAFALNEGRRSSDGALAVPNAANAANAARTRVDSRLRLSAEPSSSAERTIQGTPGDGVYWARSRPTSPGGTQEGAPGPGTGTGSDINHDGDERLVISRGLDSAVVKLPGVSASTMELVTTHSGWGEASRSGDDFRPQRSSDPLVPPSSLQPAAALASARASGATQQQEMTRSVSEGRMGMILGARMKVNAAAATVPVQSEAKGSPGGSGGSPHSISFSIRRGKKGHAHSASLPTNSARVEPGSPASFWARPRTPLSLTAGSAGEVLTLRSGGGGRTTPRLGEAGPSNWARRAVSPTRHRRGGSGSRPDSPSGRSISSLTPGPVVPGGKFSKMSEEFDRALPGQQQQRGIDFELAGVRGGGGMGTRPTSPTALSEGGISSSEIEGFAYQPHRGPDAQGGVQHVDYTILSGAEFKRAVAAMQLDAVVSPDTRKDKGPPDKLRRYFVLAIFILLQILIPALFFTFTAPYIYHAIHPAPVFIAAYLFAVTSVSFAVAGMRNPGVLPTEIDPNPPFSAQISRNSPAIGAINEEDHESWTDESPRRRIALAKLGQELRKVMPAALKKPRERDRDGGATAGLGQNWELVERNDGGRAPAEPLATPAPMAFRPNATPRRLMRNAAPPLSPPRDPTLVAALGRSNDTASPVRAVPAERDGRQTWLIYDGQDGDLARGDGQMGNVARTLFGSMLPSPLRHRSSTRMVRAVLPTRQDLENQPMPRDLRVRQWIVRTRWCSICQVYPPPRSYHCKICGHCVKDLQYHTSWLGGDLGARNLVPFLGFLIFATISLVYVIVFTALHLAGLARLPDGAKAPGIEFSRHSRTSFRTAMADAPFSAVLFIGSFVLLAVMVPRLYLHIKCALSGETNVQRVSSLPSSLSVLSVCMHICSPDAPSPLLWPAAPPKRDRSKVQRHPTFQPVRSGLFYEQFFTYPLSAA